MCPLNTSHYDVHDAALVRDRIRASAGLDVAVKGLAAIYREILEEDSASPDALVQAARSIPQQLFLRLYWGWSKVPSERQATILRTTGLRIIKDKVRRAFLGV